MTLPYPPELEHDRLRGLISTHPGAPRIDASERVRDLVRWEGHRLKIADRELAVPARSHAPAIVETFQRAISARMQARRPNATDDTWRELRAIIRGQLETAAFADVRTLGRILDAIDGL